jgi:hypothetical protein
MNGSSFAFLCIIDGEIYDEMSIQYFSFLYTAQFYILLNKSSSSNQKNSKHSSFDLFWWNKSNGSSFAFLHIDVKIYDKTQNSAVNVNKNAVLFNISSFIVCKNVKLLLFNLSHQDKSNKLCFKFF